MRQTSGEDTGRLFNQRAFDSRPVSQLRSRFAAISNLPALQGARLSTLNHPLSTFPMANYGINGFGRIGRNVLRAMDQSDVKRIAAINDLTDTLTLAHLLKWDSVHGKFDGEIGHDPENIIVRGHKIKVLKERDPGNLPWKDLGVEVVLESTGFFTSRDKAELHLTKGGAKRVLISAPAKNPDVTLCLGVNDEALRRRTSISSFRTRAAPRTVSLRWPRCCTTISGS